MQIEGESIILATSTKLILEEENSNLINIWEEGNLENCVLISKEFICHNHNFYLQPVTNE